MAHEPTSFSLNPPDTVSDGCRMLVVANGIGCAQLLGGEGTFNAKRPRPAAPNGDVSSQLPQLDSNQQPFD